ncbi:response regulator [Sabulicella rubraurantiaca]|uniref:response regulator n=1 Tax=Sabulicella rubraurantiaca TaxID=2811429 RepID=UPI001A96E692|nr:response regulator [Sabulicella rubraurantiaca]
MKRTTVSERALVLAPRGRDTQIATAILGEAGISATPCTSLTALIRELNQGAAFALMTEEAIATADLHGLAAWLNDQEEWSDLPFVLLTNWGAGFERNPAAARHLELLGNVTFLERPFHPTTLVSLARSALRARRRQYEARARLIALRESEERYRTLFETMDEGFCVIEFLDGPYGLLSDYVHVQANPAYSSNTGIPDIVGKRLREIVSREEADAWADIYRRILISGEAVRFERELAETGRHLELAAFRVEPPSRRQVAVIFKDATARKHAEAALCDLNVNLEQKVTEAVAERAAATAQLHEAQKLEVIGQLTGGVAHDINNLLTPITGALDLLARRHADRDPRMIRLIDGALQSAERARVLVSRLLGFARRQALETRPVDVATLVEGMRDLVASSIGPGTQLRVLLAKDMPSVLVDPNQLELALLNLSVNARDAMPEGGVLTIAAEPVVVGPGEAPRLSPGAYVRLSVIDMGTGMDKETLAHAVEPFYSTKGVGKGTGLGLSMVHGLMGQLGGAFVLTSALGEGTRADLFLPLANATAEPMLLSDSKPLASMRPAVLLLVDDEELVRAGTAAMLRDMGHTVHEAEGGFQALDRLRAGLEVDAVVTDYIMPRMNGAELSRKIRERHPDIPILVITGYAGGDLNIGLPQLAKPFRQSDLAVALERVFGRSSNVTWLRR